MDQTKNRRFKLNIVFSDGKTLKIDNVKEIKLSEKFNVMSVTIPGKPVAVINRDHVKYYTYESKTVENDSEKGENNESQ